MKVSISKYIFMNYIIITNCNHILYVHNYIIIQTNKRNDDNTKKL